MKKHRLFKYLFEKFEFADDIVRRNFFKSGFIILSGTVCITYVVMAVSLHFNQEALIFLSRKLTKDHKFSFSGNFKEQYFRTSDNVTLHGILFKAPYPKGLIFYLHGTLGAVDIWGKIAPVYNNLGYDIFIMDYRSYGKSGGVIQNEAQFFDDVSLVYHQMLKQYPESKIIIAGHSLGSAPATYLASRNNPKAVILLRPYYNLIEYGSSRFPLLPEALHRYTFMANEYIKDVKAPIYIFHDNKRNYVSYRHSVELLKNMKPSDHLYTIGFQKQIGIDMNYFLHAHLYYILTFKIPPQYLANAIKAPTKNNQKFQHTNNPK